MLAEPFASGNSLLHRLDPRLRVGAATLFSLIVALSFKFSVLLSAFAASLVLVIVGRLEAEKVFKRLLVINGFILLLWLVLPLTFQGEVLADLGPLKVYLD